MRKKITQLLFVVVIIFLLFILPTNYAFKVSISYDEIERYADMLFWQIDQLMEHSKQDMEYTKKDFEKECIKNAKIAAKIIEDRPEVMQAPEKARELAKLMDIDEIHCFDSQGNLYAGTNIDSYGSSFPPGAQMEYLAPMLEDHSLELCQQRMSSTDNKKIMQYAAVWREDGKGIVEIGAYPERVLNVIERRMLDSVMALIPQNTRGNTYLIQAQTGVVLASTNKTYVGENVCKVIDLAKAKEDSITIDEIYYERQKITVVLRKSGEYIYINTHNFRYIMQTLLLDTVVLLSYLVLLSVVTVTFILFYMDKKLVRSLEDIVAELNKIEEGSIENIAVKTNVPELEVLLYYINKMLQSVLSSFQKFSMIIEKSNIPIGIYEYNVFYNKAFTNKNVFDILRMEEVEDQQSTESLLRVGERILKIRENVQNLEEKIYRIEEGGQVYYIRLEEFCYGQSNIFWMMDVSQWWDRMELLKSQRDIDVLTNLYNRRAFYELIETLFEQPDNLKHAAVVMIDADKLKYINDVYGHQQGDQYLAGIAALLTRIETNHSICARLGGDEFTMLLYGYDSQEALQTAILSLLEQRDHALVQIGDEVRMQLQFSIGYACYRKDGIDWQQLIHCADERMYADKKQRKMQAKQNPQVPENPTE